MQLNSLTPNLMVKDVNKTLDFYTNILGFELIQTVPEQGAFDWAMVQSGGVSLMFQKENSIKAEYPNLDSYEKGGALTLYIKVESVKEMYESLKDKTNVIKPIHKTFYGADEFAIMDLNSFILTFSGIA